MKVSLIFDGSGSAAIDIHGETDAERSILAYLAEGYSKRWRVAVPYSYHAGGVEKVQLVEAELQQSQTEGEK